MKTTSRHGNAPKYCQNVCSRENTKDKIIGGMHRHRANTLLRLAESYGAAACLVGIDYPINNVATVLPTYRNV